jgi:hypothetical protein
MKNPDTFAPVVAIATFAAALALSATSQAIVVNPPITWTPPTGLNIAADTDVATTGTPVAAFNLGTTGVAATTINGVTFAPFAVVGDDGPGTPTVGNFKLTFTNELASNTAFGSASAPFSNLSASYQSLLSAGISDNNGSFTLTMSGLTNGQAYLFQWWANSASSNIVNLNATSTATSMNAVTLQDNVNQAEGGPGQYAIGTFTANTGGQETVTFSSSFRPVLNGFQLRAVPEPSTVALGFLGVAFLAFRRHRKHRNPSRI